MGKTANASQNMEMKRSSGVVGGHGGELAVTIGSGLSRKQQLE